MMLMEKNEKEEFISLLDDYVRAEQSWPYDPKWIVGKRDKLINFVEELTKPLIHSSKLRNRE